MPLANIASILKTFDIDIAPMEVSGITLDSRQVTAGDVFVCLSDDYIQQAIDKGACLVLHDSEDAQTHGNSVLSAGVPVIHFYHLAKCLGKICDAFYAQPSSHLCGTAVTGTNGKTSVSQLVAQVLAQCEQACGVIGTLGVNLVKQTDVKQSDEASVHLRHNRAPLSVKLEHINVATTINTTPDTVSIHKQLAQLREQGAGAFCIEASSHGLHQDRLNAVTIHTAVFTNLSQDHLDYHADMAQYAACKRLLLAQQGLQALVLNLDDKESEKWIAHAPRNCSVLGFSLEPAQENSNSEEKDRLHGLLKANPHIQLCTASNIQYLPNGSTFLLTSPWGEAQVHIGLLGGFNIQNTLAAVCVALAQGHAFSKVIASLVNLQGVAGRMEVFASAKASIIVDYAHTPDALQQALQAAREHTQGQLAVVFGCGGDRDNSKRAMMGSIAQQYADTVILTQDNSRTEQPQAIIDDILVGMQSGNAPHIELDRKLAIKQAWQHSQAGDVILAAGKGHEDYLELGNTRVPYNERSYVQQLITELPA